MLLSGRRRLFPTIIAHISCQGSRRTIEYSWRAAQAALSSLRAAKRRAVPSVRASARDRSPRYPRNPTRARGRSRIQCARSPPQKGWGYREGVGKRSGIIGIAWGTRHAERERPSKRSGATRSGSVRAITPFRMGVCLPFVYGKHGRAREAYGARTERSDGARHLASAPPARPTYAYCRTPVTLDPAPPACYAKRADSDAGSSVPRAAVGSDSLARWSCCFKGASRRAPRGHYRTISASGYVASSSAGSRGNVILYGYIHAFPYPRIAISLWPCQQGIVLVALLPCHLLTSFQRVFASTHHHMYAIFVH